MKPVWILEKYETAEEMQKTFNLAKRVFEETTDPKAKEKAFYALERFANKISDNPNGMWSGYFGKVEYPIFCREAIRLLVDNMKLAKSQGNRLDIKKTFRVVKAEIETSSTTIVFDRMYEYHQRMHEVFPGCKFKLIKSIELEGRKNEKI